MKRFVRIVLPLCVVAAVALLVMALAQSTTIVATQGTPRIDGIPGDAEWGEEISVSLPLVSVDGGGPENAKLRAAYDDEYVYLSVIWQDPTGTESIQKNTWTYDAASGSWSRSGDEDRVYVLWNINASDFERGCTTYCHVGLPSWEGLDTKMGTNNPGEVVDTWHWKAARTNPLDYADDKHWVDPTNADGGETRLSDAGSGFYSTNKSGDLPLYMQVSDPGTSSPFLFATAAVDFDATADWADGDIIPGYTLKQPSGSRADVTAVGRYNDGVWVVEFMRKLDTGNSDDAAFAAGNDYAFSLGISDNSGASKNGAPLLTLRLE